VTIYPRIKKFSSNNKLSLRTILLIKRKFERELNQPRHSIKHQISSRELRIVTMGSKINKIILKIAVVTPVSKL
jgi:hypothetical protein